MSAPPHNARLDVFFFAPDRRFLHTVRAALRLRCGRRTRRAAPPRAVAERKVFRPSANRVCWGGAAGAWRCVRVSAGGWSSRRLCRRWCSRRGGRRLGALVFGECRNAIADRRTRGCKGRLSPEWTLWAQAMTCAGCPCAVPVWDERDRGCQRRITAFREHGPWSGRG